MKSRVTIGIFILVFWGLVLLLCVNGKSSSDYAHSQLVSLDETPMSGAECTEENESAYGEPEVNHEPAVDDSIFEICKP